MIRPVTRIAQSYVDDLRARLESAHRIAATRFRESFAGREERAPNDRWQVHLEIQAECFLGAAREVKIRSGHRIAFVFHADKVVQPIVIPVAAAAPGPSVAVLPPERSFFPFFEIDRTATALLEYWTLASHISASPTFAVTELIASAEEYSGALDRMVDPRIVKALHVEWSPEGEWLEDGTARLAVGVLCRAGSERVERRQLFLDRNQEFHSHGRELIAEGSGGVPVD